MADIKGDTSIKFGVDGASESKIGIVESVTITENPDTTVEARSPKGEYETGKSAVHFRGKKTDVVISGFCKSVDMPQAGDTLTVTAPSDFKLEVPSKVYVVSAEVSCSVGDYVRCSITGVGHAEMN